MWKIDFLVYFGVPARLSRMLSRYENMKMKDDVQLIKTKTVRMLVVDFSQPPWRLYL